MTALATRAGRPGVIASTARAQVHAAVPAVLHHHHAPSRHVQQHTTLCLPTRRSLLLGTGAALLAFAAQPRAALARPSTAEVLEQVQRDFTDKQYYVTGNATRSLFDPNCKFVDPTVTVEGVDKYLAAVASLFDPATSRADLVDIRAVGDNTIRLRWRLEGALKLGGLKIKPYTGTTLYVLDPQTGLVREHLETWDISALDAFVSTFVPSFGAPAAPPVTHGLTVTGNSSG